MIGLVWLESRAAGFRMADCGRMPGDGRLLSAFALAAFCAASILFLWMKFVAVGLAAAILFEALDMTLASGSKPLLSTRASPPPTFSKVIYWGFKGL